MEPIKPQSNFEQELRSMGFAQEVIDQLKGVTDDIQTAIELGFTLQEDHVSKNQYNNVDNSEDEEYKMVIVVRRDLKMSTGKLSAQVGHGVAQKKYPQNIERYGRHGTPKIVLKVQTEQDLVEVYEKARDSNIPCSLIIDAGRTEIPPNSKTVVGIGPGKLISKQK